MLTLNEILKATKGEIIIDKGYKSFKSLSTDTRKIEKDSIFVALKGENFNGNKFAEEAGEKGASIVIVDELEWISQNIKSTVIRVKNTRDALLDLAKFYREKLGVKIIAVTGSTGKTSTKDILAALLSKKYKVFKTKGNFNNEVGLPLMIFSMDESYDIAILEMGMSNFNEIHRLANAGRPDIALITNIGISHIENLKSRENILKAKMEITDFFNKDSVLIVNGNDDLLKNLKSSKYKIIKTTINGNGDINGENLKVGIKESSFIIELKNKRKEFTLPLPGKHNIENCLLGIAAGLNLGLSIEEMEEGLKNLEKTSMRLEILNTKSFTIVNDCYNASPSSMKSSIDTVKSINGKRKIAILGTMKELGEFSYEAHKEVGEYGKNNDIDIIMVCGDYSEGFVEGFSKDTAYKFENKEDLIKALKDKVKENDVILVKASRAMKFEDITKKLLDLAANEGGEATH